MKVQLSMCQQIWKTQQWPWTGEGQFSFQSLRKTNAKECSNYHTIALISHASNVMLKNFQARVQQYVNRELPDVQSSSVAQSCQTLCDPMNRSTPGLPVHHQLREFTQTCVHRVSDAIQPDVQARFKKRQANQRSNCQHPLDHRKSKRIPGRHIVLLH